MQAVAEAARGVAEEADQAVGLDVERRPGLHGRHPPRLKPGIGHVRQRCDRRRAKQDAGEAETGRNDQEVAYHRQPVMRCVGQ